MTDYGYGIEVRYAHDSTWKGKFHRTVVVGNDVVVQWGPLQYMSQYVGAGECTSTTHHFDTPEAAAKKAASLVSSKVTKGYKPVGDLVPFRVTGNWPLNDFIRSENNPITATLAETISLIEENSDENTAGYLLAIAAQGNSLTSEIALSLSEHPSLAVRKAVSRHVTLAAIL